MVDFKTLKDKVGIDDVAYSLGYRVNRKAGVGKYLEMVPVPLIVSNPSESSVQVRFSPQVPEATISAAAAVNGNRLNTSSIASARLKNLFFIAFLLFCLISGIIFR